MSFSWNSLLKCSGLQHVPTRFHINRSGTHLISCVLAVRPGAMTYDHKHDGYHQDLIDYEMRAAQGILVEVRVCELQW